MKKAVLLWVTIFIMVSCTKDDFNANQKYSSRTDDNADFITLNRAILSNFTTTYATTHTTKKAAGPNFYNTREEAIDSLMGKFIPYLIHEIDNSKERFASFTLSNDKEKGILSVDNVIIYQLKNLTVDELGWFYAFLPQNLYLKDEKKSYLQLTCEGGKKNGNSIVVERPSGFASTIKFGKKISTFSTDCIDGGGCIKICKVNMAVDAGNPPV